MSVVEIAEWKSARPSWWFLHIRIKIVERHFSRGRRHHRNWAVWREEIRYGAQGRSDGYTIDCATACKGEASCCNRRVRMLFSKIGRGFWDLDLLDKAIEDPLRRGAVNERMFRL